MAKGDQIKRRRQRTAEHARWECYGEKPGKGESLGGSGGYLKRAVREGVFKEGVFEGRLRRKQEAQSREDLGEGRTRQEAHWPQTQPHGPGQGGIFKGQREAREGRRENTGDHTPLS